MNPSAGVLRYIMCVMSLITVCVMCDGTPDVINPGGVNVAAPC